MASMPMFPLESVLVPGMVLPLQVFEERYRSLVRDCLAGDKEFGVVLIERGSEVGGGDTRSMVGTVAEIVRAEEVPDGRWAVVAVGTRRLRVVAWLDDDPYPRAKIVPWPDQAAADVAALHERFDHCIGEVRRGMAMAVELGESADALAEITEQPDLGSYQLSMIAPLGPLDRQRLLEAEGPAERLDLLAELIAEANATFEARLAQG